MATEEVVFRGHLVEIAGGHLHDIDAARRREGTSMNLESSFL